MNYVSNEVEWEISSYPLYHVNLSFACLYYSIINLKVILFLKQEKIGVSFIILLLKAMTYFHSHPESYFLEVILFSSAFSSRILPHLEK